MSSLFGAAPAILNTIVELATALGNDSNYETTMQTQVNTKADKLDTYHKADINVALGVLQAGIESRVIINAVDINGKFKIHDVSNDILKIQGVDGTTVYDAFEVSFNPVDKTSTLATNNVNLLQDINNNAVVVNVYSNSDIDIGLNLKSDKNTTYLKSGVDVFVCILQAAIDRRVLIHAVDSNGKFKMNATSNDILKFKELIEVCYMMH